MAVKIKYCAFNSEVSLDDKIARFRELEVDLPTDIVKPTDSVYFVRMAGTQYVKVGVSSDVPARITCLKTGCPTDLVLSSPSGAGTLTWSRLISTAYSQSKDTTRPGSGSH